MAKYKRNFSNIKIEHRKTKIMTELNEAEHAMLDYFMKQALEQASIAYSLREVPVGCVIVLDGQIIGRGGNRTNMKKNATRHAEFEAIDEILLHREMSRDDWQKAELYVTCEPCVMCASALGHLNIGKVYFGCSNERFGGCGSIYSIHERGHQIPSGRSYTCVKGIYEKEAVELFRRFYSRVNVNAPNPRKRTIHFTSEAPPSDEAKPGEVNKFSKSQATDNEESA